MAFPVSVTRRIWSEEGLVLGFDHRKMVLYWVNRLGFVARRQLQAKFQVHGQNVTPEEWAVLLILWDSNSQTPGALADATIKDRTTMTRLIDSMVKKRLVKRSEDAQDRRRSVVRLTDEGEKLRSILIPLATDFAEQSRSGISDEDLSTTLRCLMQIFRNFEKNP